ncbi:MAG: peptidylprolyl isomerase [Thermoanaerobaculia bacterium]
MGPSFRKSCVALASVGLLAACRSAPEPDAAASPDPEAIVARFSGGEIRRSEIAAAVARRLASVPGPVAPETRRLIVRKVVERRVRITALRAEVKAKGYQELPEARYRARAAEERLLAADLLAGELTDARAADTLVAAAVERRLQSLRPEEARKFSHIFLRARQEDSAARTKASATMADILAALASGTGFNALAERHSDSAMARGGGRIEWTLRKNLQPAAAAAIFELREGAVSPVVETPDGLHLFRLDGIRSGSLIDVEATRRAVRKELDAETVVVAERALRQRELDGAGVEFAPPRQLERLPEKSDAWVARWQGGEVRASELLAVTLPASAGAAPRDAVLRELIENRLLTARRRQVPISPELEARVAEGREEALLESYRLSLVASIDSEPTAEEIAQFYRENVEGALFLRDYHVDLLFFPQTGESVAGPYAAAEEVVAKLRDGTPFEAVLDLQLTPDARVCRDAHPIHLEELGKSFLRLRKALLNLEVGGVSPALYFDGPRSVIVPGKCLLEGRGVAFVHLREVGALPFESAREIVRAQVAAQKERAGIDAIQARLVTESGLEILLPEG